MILSRRPSSSFLRHSRPDVRGALLGVTVKSRELASQGKCFINLDDPCRYVCHSRPSFPISIWAVGGQCLGNYWAILIPIQPKLSSG